VLDLSPTKLLIIFVVVVVLLGPKRLPEVARQLGAGWRKVRELHLRLDQELRQAVPDLPSSQDIVRFARSPVALLNQLADVHDEAPSQDPDTLTEGAAGARPAGTSTAGNGTRPASTRTAGTRPASPRPASARPASARPARQTGGDAERLVAPALARLDTDDPNLN
jgi:sec-independent protein translocase protein TatB